MKYLAIVLLACFVCTYGLPNGQPANNTDVERGLHVRKNVTQGHNGKDGVDVLCFCYTKDTQLHGSFNGIKCTCSKSLEEILDSEPDERALALERTLTRPDPFSQKVTQDKDTVKALNYVLFGPQIKPVLDNFTSNHPSAQVGASAGVDERGLHVKKNISHHFNASREIFCFCHIADTELQGSVNDFDCSCTPTVAEIISAYDEEPTERRLGRKRDLVGIAQGIGEAILKAKEKVDKGASKKAAGVTGPIAGGATPLSG